MRLGLGLQLARQSGTGVEPTPPTNLVAPSISGTPTEGQELFAIVGAWASGSEVSYAYQWYADGVAISGAINQTRVMTSDEVGDVITVGVVATNTAGSSEEVLSAPTAEVAAAAGAVPENTVAPAITGNPYIESTLSVSDGTWDNTPTSYAYQWRRDGVNILDAIFDEYTLTSEDAGTAITCRVFATNANGTGIAVSNSVAVAAYPLAYESFEWTLSRSAASINEGETISFTITLDQNGYTPTAASPPVSIRILVPPSVNGTTLTAGSFDFNPQSYSVSIQNRVAITPGTTYRKIGSGHYVFFNLDDWSGAPFVISRTALEDGTEGTEVTGLQILEASHGTILVDAVSAVINEAAAPASDFSFTPADDFLAVGTASGAVVGTFAATSGVISSIVLTDDADGIFAIDGSNLETAATADFEGPADSNGVTWGVPYYTFTAQVTFLSTEVVERSYTIRASYPEIAPTGNETATLAPVTTLTYNTSTSLMTRLASTTSNRSITVSDAVVGTQDVGANQPLIRANNLTVRGHREFTAIMDNYYKVYGGNNLIFRNLIFRGGDDMPGRGLSDRDGGFGIAGGDTVLVENCSFGQGVDELMSLYWTITTGLPGIRNIIFRYCLFAEQLRNYRHPFGTLISHNNMNIVFDKCLFYGMSQRNIEIKQAFGVVQQNCIIAYASLGAGLNQTSASQPEDATWIFRNNLFIPRGGSRSSAFYMFRGTSGEIYAPGNHFAEVDDFSDDPFIPASHTQLNEGSLLTVFKDYAPFDCPSYNLLPTDTEGDREALFTHVINRVGCRLLDGDGEVRLGDTALGAVDYRLITQFRAGLPNQSIRNTVAPATGVSDFTYTKAIHDAELASLPEFELPLISSQLLTDASYSWWNRPLAIYRNGKTVFGTVESDGTQWVHEVTNSTLAVTSFQVYGSYPMDDHNAPSVDFLSDGRLVVLYTGHNDDSVLRYRISTDSTIANLGSEQTKATSATATYNQIIVHGTEVLFLTRIGVHDWVLFRSTNSLTSLGSELKLVDTAEQSYVLARYMPGRSRIRVLHTYNPQYSPVLRIMDIDLSAIAPGLASVSGTGVGYTSGAASGAATLPAVIADLAAIYTPAALHTFRLLDINDTGDAILLADFVASDNSDLRLKLGRLTGANPHNSAHWTWSDLIASYGVPFDSDYVPGAEFAREPHAGHRIYVARKESGGTSYVERYDSTDWSTWTVTEIDSSTTEMFRPLTVRDADYRLAMTYLKGDYTDFDSVLSLYSSNAPEEDFTYDTLQWHIASTTSVDESSTATFVISWSGAPITTSVTVDLTQGGTAHAVNDFDETLADAITAAAATGVSFDGTTLTIASTATSPLTFTRTLNTDITTEGAETYTLTLSNASDGTIKDAVATIAIEDSSDASGDPWDFVAASATPSSVTSGNLTFTEPAGVQSGDLMVAAIGYRSTAAFTLPTGWSLVATQQSSGDTAASPGIASIVMAYIVRGGSAPDLTFTRTGGDVANGRILAYRNNHASPYDTGSANTLGASATTATTGTITTAQNNELLVVAVANPTQTASLPDAFTAATDPTSASSGTDTTTEPGSTWLRRATLSSTTGADITLAMADAVKGTAGATGQISASMTSNRRHAMVVGAFKRAVP